MRSTSARPIPFASSVRGAIGAALLALAVAALVPAVAGAQIVKLATPRARGLGVGQVHARHGRPVGRRHAEPRDPARLPGRRGGRRARPGAQDAHRPAAGRGGHHRRAREHRPGVQRLQHPDVLHLVPRALRHARQARADAQGSGSRPRASCCSPGATAAGCTSSPRTRSTTVDGLRKTKLFFWAGDDEMVALWKRLHFQPVPLVGHRRHDRPADRDDRRLPDDAAARARRCSGTARPRTWSASGMAPLVGGLVITKSAWAKIAAADQAKIQAACAPLRAPARGRGAAAGHHRGGRDEEARAQGQRRDRAPTPRSSAPRPRSSPPA